MLQCVESGVQKVVVRTVDTDVIILLVAYRHLGGNYDSNVYVWFAVSKNVCFMTLISFLYSLGFFHTFTGHFSTRESANFGTDGMNLKRKMN